MPSTQIAYSTALNVRAICQSRSAPDRLVALVGQIISQSRFEIIGNTKVTFIKRAAVHSVVVSQTRLRSLTQPDATVCEPKRRSSLQIPVLRVRLDSRAW